MLLIALCFLLTECAGSPHKRAQSLDGASEQLLLVVPIESRCRSDQELQDHHHRTVTDPSSPKQVVLCNNSLHVVDGDTITQKNRRQKQDDGNWNLMYIDDHHGITSDSPANNGILPEAEDRVTSDEDYYSSYNSSGLFHLVDKDISVEENDMEKLQSIPQK